MKIYLTIVQDRHVDPEAFPFSTKDRAIARALKIANMYSRKPSDIRVDKKPPLGWLYRVEYSTEGDCAWVLEKELDAK